MSDQEQTTSNDNYPESVPPSTNVPPMQTAQGTPYTPWIAPTYGTAPPQTNPPLVRISRRNILLASFALVPILVLVLGGLAVVAIHAFSKPDGYLFNSSTNVTFIQFTEDQSGHLSGSLQSVDLASDETVQSETAAFTGIRNGSQISLTFSALGSSATVQGTLDGNTLTLHLPDQNGYVATEVFHGASTSDYNDAAAKLRQRASAFAAATQSSQATVTEQQAEIQATADTQNALDQAVAGANAQLSTDLGALNTDIQNLAGNTDFSETMTSYASDWAQMQKDYQQEKTDYNQGCGTGGYNAGVVAYDASTVSYDLNSITYDDSSLTYDENAPTTSLQNVQNDMQGVQTDWQTLQAAVAADSTGSVSAAFTQSDVTAAAAKGQQAVDGANKALKTAQGQAQQYDREAAQTNTAAQNLANSMHC